MWSLGRCVVEEGDFWTTETWRVWMMGLGCWQLMQFLVPVLIALMVLAINNGYVENPLK